jgi:hypothetical protein
VAGLRVLIASTLIWGFSPIKSDIWPLFPYHPLTGSATEQRNYLVGTQSVMHCPRVSLSASCIRVLSLPMPGGMGANLRPQGLASWTGRLPVSSMAPVVGSGHLILCHPFLRLTSKVSTGRALMPGGPKSIDTVVPSLESKSLPRRGPGASGTYRNQCLTPCPPTVHSWGSQNRYFLVFLVAPLMVIESLVSQLVGVVTVEMATAVSRMKSI